MRRRRLRGAASASAADAQGDHAEATLVDLAHVAVAQRAGVSPTFGPALAAVRAQRHCAPAGLSSRPAGCITEFTMTPVAASATEIRRLLKTAGPDADRRLAEIVPAAVLDYIRAHHLYA